MIYFIEAVETDGTVAAIKVGYSDNIGRRFIELQIGNHLQMRILEIWEGDRYEESILHTALAEHRIRGEWFKPNAVYAQLIDRAVESLDEFMMTIRTQYDPYKMIYLVARIEELQKHCANIVRNIDDSSRR